MWFSDSGDSADRGRRRWRVNGVHNHLSELISHLDGENWVIVLHLGLEGCSQPRELWFIDILMKDHTKSTPQYT